MKMTLANILTLSRLFIAPIFLVFALSENPTGITIALILFAFAAISDWGDGYLARKYGEVTEQGEFLDPLADKVLTTSAFVTFYMLDVVPLWMVIVIVLRDFGTTVMRSIADERGHHITTSFHAKIKTFLQMTFIVYGLILLWMSYHLGPDGRSWAFDLLYSDWTYGLMLLITAITVWTALEYLVSNRGILKKQ